MKLTKVLLMLAGLAGAAGHNNLRRAHNHHRGNCGRVCVIPQDRRTRTNRCMHRLRRELEEDLRVTVVAGNRQSCLLRVFVDKDRDCDDMIEMALERAENRIRRRNNRGRTNYCLRGGTSSTGSSTSKSTTTKGTSKSTSKSTIKSTSKSTSSKSSRPKSTYKLFSSKSKSKGSSSGDYL